MSRTTCTCWILAIAALPLSLALADSFDPPRLPDDLSFEVVRTPVNVQGEWKEGDRISIRIDGGKAIDLGLERVSEFAGREVRDGVDPSTLRVHPIKDSPALLHIEWTDYMSDGTGHYQNAFYRIVRASEPDKPIAAGSVPLSGRWGWGTGNGGSHKVEYLDGMVRISETVWGMDTSKNPKPLYHPMSADKGEWYQAKILTTTMHHIKVDKQCVKRLYSLLGYRVQEGDTIEDICKGLDLEAKWNCTADPKPRTGLWLIFNIPAEVAVKRYPLTREAGK